jgi:2-polyprenyl-3-methyl-5-hydroxy-6-metoxy-1,4-benzoquinol methylase
MAAHDGAWPGRLPRGFSCAKCGSEVTSRSAPRVRYGPVVEADLSNRVGDADERFVPGSARGSLIEAQHLARYLWATPLARGRRVLDAGCGVGYGTAMLGDAGAAEAVGVDISAAAVEAASDGAPSNTSFLTGDVHALPFDDGRFDLVVCFEVIEHVDRQDEVIAELARVLAPGGVLALSSPNRDVYVRGNPHHVHEYVPQELRAALERCFAHVDLYRQHDWMTSAVLDDAQVAVDGVGEALDLRLAKVFGERPGSEPYTIALASRQPLPVVAGTAVLGAAAEARAWLEELSQLRDDVGRNGHMITSLTVERDRARADVATLQDIEEQLRSDVNLLVGELEQVRTTVRAMRGSVSWRLTRPLRDVRRRLQRNRSNPSP